MEAARVRGMRRQAAALALYNLAHPLGQLVNDTGELQLSTIEQLFQKLDVNNDGQVSPMVSLVLLRYLWRDMMPSNGPFHPPIFNLSLFNPFTTLQTLRSKERFKLPHFHTLQELRSLIVGLSLAQDKDQIDENVAYW